MTTPPPLASLIPLERMGSDGALTLALLLYAPMGLCLCVLRIFIGLHAFLVACLLPKTLPVRGFILRCLCSVLGLVVTEEGEPDPDVRLLVANHISPLDHVALGLRRPAALANLWDLPPMISWLCGCVEVGARQGRQALMSGAKAFVQSSELPLLTFPEGVASNGRVGLLKFSTWPFALGRPVQPALISLRRPSPFAGVAATVLGARWWLDAAWTLFLPYTHYQIRWLPTQSPGSDSSEAFASRVSAAMGKEAGLATTAHTAADVAEYAKRLLREQRAAERRPKAAAKRAKASLSPAQLDSMALKVKETFPQVPLAAIRADLDQSLSAEATAANILEGRLRAESPPRDGGSWRSELEERKWDLVETNRRAYLAKRGLSL